MKPNQNRHVPVINPDYDPKDPFMHNPELMNINIEDSESSDISVISTSSNTKVITITHHQPQQIIDAVAVHPHHNPNHNPNITYAPKSQIQSQIQSQNQPPIIGKGSYGQVKIINNFAVKKFDRLNYLIQEYCALKYLEDCNHIVHAHHVDFRSLELYMDLYQCNLRQYINKHQHMDYDTITAILSQILKGLIELHDRNLSHGDIKPGNILCNLNPLKIVLGDCGFVSNYKYAKIDRTTHAYRDPNILHDGSHDIFSFGIIFLEIFGGRHISKQETYEALSEYIDKYVMDPKFNSMLHKCLSEDRISRPTARQLLYTLTGECPKYYTIPKITKRFKISLEFKRHLVNYLNQKVSEFKLSRGKKGYGAIKAYAGNNIMSIGDIARYSCVTFIIMSSLFGMPGFGMGKCCLVGGMGEEEVYDLLGELCNDRDFLAILLSDSKDKLG